jgi:hypothetical protein
MADFTPAEWAELRPLLDEMFDLAPKARAEWLARQRAAHPALGDRLEELLARDAQADVSPSPDRRGRPASAGRGACWRGSPIPTSPASSMPA